MAQKLDCKSIGKNCKKFLKLSVKSLCIGESTTHTYKDGDKINTLVFSKRKKGIKISKNILQPFTAEIKKGFFLNQTDFEILCSDQIKKIKNEENKRSSASKQPRKYKNKIAKHLSFA